jgi:hypothetical protein
VTADIHTIRKELDQQLAHPKRPRVDGTGRPPHDGDMEARIEKLEKAAEDTRDRLIKIETRLDVFATKEDLHKELHSMTWKIFGGCALLVAAVYFIAKHIG